MNKPIKYIDDMPKDAIYAVKALREMFRGTSFEADINETFLRNYNEGKDRGIGQ